MRLILIPLVLMAAACTSPSAGYLGAPRQDVTVGGMRFAVYAQGADAQVIRLDRLRRADRALMPARMADAARIATGCTPIANSVVPVGGPYSAVANVGLRCP